MILSYDKLLQKFLTSFLLWQALLYRLSGDYNPLHSDPMVATVAGLVHYWTAMLLSKLNYAYLFLSLRLWLEKFGSFILIYSLLSHLQRFSQPILHGLCTLGFAVRAIIKCICRGDPDMIKTISGRFLLHVYPGEKLVTEMWLEGMRYNFVWYIVCVTLEVNVPTWV